MIGIKNTKSVFAMLALLLLVSCSTSQHTITHDVIIRSGTLYDGSATPGRFVKGPGCAGKQRPYQ